MKKYIGKCKAELRRFVVFVGTKGIGFLRQQVIYGRSQILSATPDQFGKVLQRWHWVRRNSQSAITAFSVLRRA